MKTELPTGRVRYAESKVAFFESETEQWLKDHREAQACQESELLVRDLNVLLADMLQLDREVHTSYCEGMPYNEQLSKRIEQLFHRWCRVAMNVEVGASAFELKGYSVEGIVELRRGIKEVSAMIEPSDEVDGWMAKLRDDAIESHAKGTTIEGLVD